MSRTRTPSSALLMSRSSSSTCVASLPGGRGPVPASGLTPARVVLLGARIGRAEKTARRRIPADGRYPAHAAQTPVVRINDHDIVTAIPELGDGLVGDLRLHD